MYKTHLELGCCHPRVPSRLHPRYGFYTTRSQPVLENTWPLEAGGSIPLAFHPCYRQVLLSIGMTRPFRVCLRHEIVATAREHTAEEKERGDQKYVVNFACGIPTDTLYLDKFWIQCQDTSKKDRWIAGAGLCVVRSEVYPVALVQHRLNNYRLCLGPQDMWYSSQNRLLGNPATRTPQNVWLENQGLMSKRFLGTELHFFELLPTITEDNIEEIAEKFGCPGCWKPEKGEEPVLAGKVLWLVLAIHKVEKSQHVEHPPLPMWCIDKKGNSNGGITTWKLSPYCLRVLTKRVVEGKTVVGPISFDAIVSVEGPCPFELQVGMLKVDSGQSCRITWPNGLPTDSFSQVILTPKEGGKHTFTMIDAIGLAYARGCGEPVETVPQPHARKPTLVYMGKEGGSILV